MICLNKIKKPSWVQMGFCSVLSLTIPAAYADQPMSNATTMPELFDFNWAGPYVGGYLGGALANADMTTTVNSATGAAYFTSSADMAAVGQTGTNSLHPSTPIFGVEFGDNFVISSLVTIGWVMDYGSFDLSETNTAQSRAVYCHWPKLFV